MATGTNHYISIDTEIGRIGIRSNGSEITGVFIGTMEYPDLPTIHDDVVDEAAAELAEYLEGKRKRFEVPTHQTGSDFQMEVWNGISKIPYGTTWTYGRLAEYIGHPNAYRAVGSACKKNDIPIIIPCHRVVSSSGLGGFSCGLDSKKKLMSIEGSL